MSETKHAPGPWETTDTDIFVTPYDIIVIDARPRQLRPVNSDEIVYYDAGGFPVMKLPFWQRCLVWLGLIAVSWLLVYLFVRAI